MPHLLVCCPVHHQHRITGMEVAGRKLRALQATTHIPDLHCKHDALGEGAKYCSSCRQGTHLQGDAHTVAGNLSRIEVHTLSWDVPV